MTEELKKWIEERVRTCTCGVFLEKYYDDQADTIKEHKRQLMVNAVAELLVKDQALHVTERRTDEGTYYTITLDVVVPKEGKR